MKKENVLKSNRDFTRIMKENSSKKTKYYYIYIERTENNNYHFGISVSKKIGNAVTRNKYKRRIRHIISLLDYQNGFNCIIIVKKSILHATFLETKEDLQKNLTEVIKWKKFLDF